MPATKSPARKPAKKAAPKAPASRMSLKEVMAALEKAGSEQTRRTYTRHGVPGPMFGVSFAFLKTLYKRIKIDHELALALWNTRNFDARNLAVKIVDPARMTSPDLDRWAKDYQARMCMLYVAALAAEGPHASAKAEKWLGSKEEVERSTGWGLLGQMAARDEAKPDSWFAERIALIERTIHAAPNSERYAMNQALIQMGGRSPALRKAALAAAKRIGRVDVDHGDTACKTPDAAAYIEKMWSHADAKGYPSPSAQERERESPRTRC